jgi:protein TonB
VIATAGYIVKTLLLDARNGLETTVKTEMPVETTVKPAIDDGVKDTIASTPLTNVAPANTPPPISSEISDKITKPIMRAPAPIPEQRPRQIVSRVQKEEPPAVLQPRVDKPAVKAGDQPIAGVNEKDLSAAEDQPPADFVAVAKEPTVVKRVEPKYPELAQKLGLEGRVVVRIWVDKEGKPKQVVVLKSDNEIFNQPAVEAARQFVFTPGYVSTGAVATWVAIPFKFKISVSPKR